MIACPIEIGISLGGDGETDIVGRACRQPADRLLDVVVALVTIVAQQKKLAAIGGRTIA